MNINNLNKLIKIIKKAPQRTPGKELPGLTRYFDYSTKFGYVYDDDDNRCGTCHCIGGFVTVLLKQSHDWIKGKAFMDETAEYLGLTAQQAFELCYAESLDDGCDHVDYNDIKKEHALELLYHMRDHGPVKWVHMFPELKVGDNDGKQP